MKSVVTNKVVYYIGQEGRINERKGHIAGRRQSG
jgi:hypothetical protein